MNIVKYFKPGFLSVAIMLFGAAFTACTDDIEAGRKIDEGDYDAVTRIEGMLLDRNTNKNESVVELRADEYTTDLYFALTRKPGKGVDVTISLDPAYLETYNAEHGTDFQLFPAGSVTIANGGKLLLAPDETRSVDVSVTFSGSDVPEQDVTYALPLQAVISTEGIALSEKALHAVYLIKDLRGQADTYKGPDAVRTVLYYEVNDTNPLNALEYVLEESGKLFFDEVVLFSSNINWNAETGRVYVYNNPNVQFLLDNNEEFPAAVAQTRHKGNPQYPRQP